MPHGVAVTVVVLHGVRVRVTSVMLWYCDCGGCHCATWCHGDCCCAALCGATVAVTIVTVVMVMVIVVIVIVVITVMVIILSLLYVITTMPLLL